MKASFDSANAFSAAPRSELARRQTDEKRAIVGLNLCVICGAVASKLTAFGATVGDHVAVTGIGLGSNGLHRTAASVCTVAGIDVNVERPEAERAVIARG